MATDTAAANAPYQLDLVTPKSLADLFSNQVPNSSLGYAMPTAPGLVAGGVDLGSGYTVGLLQALQIIVNQLSAISANIGTLVINVGGSLSSGQTAYGVGAGIWIGTDSSGDPQFSIQDTEGNFINISASGTNVLAISSSGLINALSSKQIDDLGWRNTSIWLDITGAPTKLAGYGITDAQGILPNATAVGQVLQRDNGGNPYFNAKYGPELDVYAADFGSGNFTANAFSQLGPDFGVVRPSINCTLCAIFYFTFGANLGTPVLNMEVDYSTDGGSTYTSGDAVAIQTSTNNQQAVLIIKNVARGTGDFRVRVRCKNTSAVNTISVSSRAVVYVSPNNNFYSVAGALSASIPTTGAGNCTATFPATTCTASVNVTATPGGGTPPYTYSWSVVSGTGTITAGSTSQTCTVSDTETATTGGATFNTTVKCVVSDSVPNNVTSNNDVITNTFTLVYAPITATVSTTNGSCNTNVCSTNCQAQGSGTANPTGGNGSYTYSWSVVSGPGSITAGATSQTCVVSETHATGPGPHIDNTVIQCSVNDTRSTGAVTPQGTVSLTFSCPSH